MVVWGYPIKNHCCRTNIQKANRFGVARKCLTRTKIRKIFSGFLLLFATAFVKPSFATSGNGVNNIVSVGIHDSSHAIIRLESSSNTEGCSTPALQNSILIQKSNPNFKLMYATALLALATSGPISVWVSGCTDFYDNGGTVIVNAITISIAK